MRPASWLFRCPRPARWWPLLALLPTATLRAQGSRRPELPAGADSNDASAWIRLAGERLQSDPRVAEQAYTRAAHLAPGTAEPIYGRFVAKLLANPDRLRRWVRGDAREMQEADLAQLDSLLTAAINMQPFFFGRYDRLLMDTYIQDALKREYGMFGSNDPELAVAYPVYLRKQEPEFRGWLAYTQQRPGEAIEFYQRALEQSNDRAGVLWNMALARYRSGDVDGAIGTLQQAVEEGRQTAGWKLKHHYESAANMEYMIGWALEQQGNSAGAREAYAQAVIDDPSFHPAHIRVGSLALLSGDTALAIRSIGTAVNARPDNVWLRWVHGALLLETSRPDSALVELKLATELEPMFASPWYDLARANDLLADSTQAIGCYREFLRRASASDPRRSRTEARIRELGGD